MIFQLLNEIFEVTESSCVPHFGLGDYWKYPMSTRTLTCNIMVLVSLIYTHGVLLYVVSTLMIDKRIFLKNCKVACSLQYPDGLFPKSNGGFFLSLVRARR